MVIGYSYGHDGQRKEGFLNGTLQRPDPNSLDFRDWKKMSSLIASWIFNTIDLALVPQISYTTNTKEPRIHELKDAISNCK